MATSKSALAGKSTSTSPQILREDQKESLNQDIHRRISEHAFQIYESSGRDHGNHHAHWLEAESKILQHGLEVRESGSWLSVNASLPDVSGEDVQVCVEPNRIIVHAEKTEATKNPESHEQGLTQHELFLAEDLNVEVDPSTASVTFKDQKLTLMVKKRYPVTAESHAERAGN
jgi:HSP20 family molecular chaperone IbpA